MGRNMEGRSCVANWVFVRHCMHEVRKAMKVDVLTNI